MNKYKIKVTERLERVIDIDNESYKNSIIDVEEKYNNQDVVLDASDYISTEFELDDSDIEITEEQYLQLLKQKIFKVKDSFENLSRFLETKYSNMKGNCYDANAFFSNEFNNGSFNESVEDLSNYISNCFDIVLDLSNKNGYEVSK